jgi:hypothetical protein
MLTAFVLPVYAQDKEEDRSSILREKDSQFLHIEEQGPVESDSFISTAGRV